MCLADKISTEHFHSSLIAAETPFSGRRIFTRVCGPAEFFINANSECKTRWIIERFAAIVCVRVESSFAEK